MTWFPDRSSCQMWGGPDFRFPFTETSFREDAKLQQLPSFGLIDEGDFVGFGQYYRRVGHCHLGRLAIAPPVRGRGLGAILIDQLGRRGRADLGVDSLSLFVLAGNDRALRLYRRLGFTAMPYPEPLPGMDGVVYMVASGLVA